MVYEPTEYHIVQNFSVPRFIHSDKIKLQRKFDAEKRLRQAKEQEISHLSEELRTKSRSIFQSNIDFSNMQQSKDKEITTLKYQLKESKQRMESEVEILKQKLAAHQKSDTRDMTHTAVQWLAVTGGITCMCMHTSTSTLTMQHI